MLSTFSRLCQSPLLDNWNCGCRLSSAIQRGHSAHSMHQELNSSCIVDLTQRVRGVVEFDFCAAG
jgi:hypothetical protein